MDKSPFFSELPTFQFWKHQVHYHTNKSSPLHLTLSQLSQPQFTPYSSLKFAWTQQFMSLLLVRRLKRVVEEPAVQHQYLQLILSQ
jgi:hypothetical protein